jgi:uncharacterized membrane protein
MSPWPSSCCSISLQSQHVGCRIHRCKTWTCFCPYFFIYILFFENNFMILTHKLRSNK